MRLKNLMEEKQLDFNQPFLTVRRLSSIPEVQERTKPDNSVPKLPPLPFYRSELKSGPVRNPGTVPFVWEQTPGRPKDEGIVMLPNQALHRPPVAPRLPPGRNRKIKQEDSDKDSHAVHSNAQTVEKSVITQPESEGSVEKGSTSCSENGDESYLDALDTFSRSESFFMNCSISGVSGMDSPDLRLSGKFSSDPQARDFMMGRFLPAAQAMASEVPQHGTRKQNVPQELPRPVKLAPKGVKKIADNENMNSPNIPSGNFSNRVKEEINDDDWYEYENPSAKVCGLLPRFCLLNPVPGMKLQCAGPHSVRTLQQKSRSAGLHNEMRSKRPVGDDQRVELQFRQMSRGRDGKRLEGSNLYKRLQVNGGLPSQKEVCPSVPQAEETTTEKSDSLSNQSNDSKRCMNFRQLLASEGSEWESGSTSPAVEKTLYVDSVLLVKDSKSLSNDGRDDLYSASSKDFDPPNDEATPETETVENVNLSLVALPDKSNDETQIETERNSKSELDIDEELVSQTSSGTCSDQRIDGKSRFAVRNSMETTTNPIFLVPPPLPKSPSDSWLSRTLLYKNSTSRALVVTNVLDRTIVSKTATDPKWETIVKTSKVHHGHLRFSEELLPPIPDS